MHGRKRIPRSEIPLASDDELALKAEKIAKYKKLYAILMQKRKEKVYTMEALELTSKMCTVNPDFTVAWNYRREILQHLWKTASPDTVKSMIAVELSLTAEGISKKNPKSYSLWHHRKWIVERGLSDIAEEIKLCSVFLDADERNFHCWDYRRSMVKLAGISSEEELHYTHEKILQNFSNYSAWHYRTKLLSSAGITIDILISELETIQQAFFTEPDDQSAWFYHRWLVDSVIRCGAEGKCSHGDIKEILLSQVAAVSELLEVEERSKWARVALCYIQGEILSEFKELPSEEIESRHSACESLYAELKELDPNHRNYYIFKLSTLAAEKVAA